MASDGPRYSLLLSTDPSLIEAAQRLRYDVFSSTPGFALPATSDGRDVDRFDEFCDHLLVRDDDTGELVGCYRMLPPAGAIAAGGLYTATEFDVRAFDSLRPSLVEMGRAVVRDGHRNGGVVLLMWAGILAYLDRYDYDYVTGCVSVPIETEGEAPGSQIRGVRDFVLERHAAAVPGASLPARAHRRQAPRRHRAAATADDSAVDARIPAGWVHRPAVSPLTTRTSVSAISACCWARATPTPDISNDCGRFRPLPTWEVPWRAEPDGDHPARPGRALLAAPRIVRHQLCERRRGGVASGPGVAAGRMPHHAGLLLAPGLPLLGVPLPGSTHVQRAYCRMVLRSLGVRIALSGSPIRNLRGVLVVSSHMSWLDVFAIGAVLPGSFVARADMFTGRASGIVARILKNHPDRADQSAAIAGGGGRRRPATARRSDGGGFPGGHHVVRSGLWKLLPGDVSGRDRRRPPGAAAAADLSPRRRQPVDRAGLRRRGYLAPVGLSRGARAPHGGQAAC